MCGVFVLDWFVYGLFYGIFKIVYDDFVKGYDLFVNFSCVVLLVVEVVFLNFVILCLMVSDVMLCVCLLGRGCEIVEDIE